MKFRIAHIPAVNKRRASILVLSLWIVVILGILSSSMLEEVYLEMRIAKMNRDNFRARMLARAGFANAITDLANDLIFDHAPQQMPVDSLNDVWARSDDGDDKLNIKLGGGKYSVWIDDEMSKININTAPPDLIKAILQELKVEEKTALELAAAIIDYRDPDNNATAPATGREDEYYSTAVAESSDAEYREGDPPIFQCKNDVFTSIDELLSVPGMTPEIFYGFNSNSEAVPDPFQTLAERGKKVRTTRERMRKRGIREVVTVLPMSSGNNFNINTVDPVAMKMILRAAIKDPAAAQTITDQIMNLRASGKTRGTGGALRDPIELTFRAGISQDVVNRINQMMRMGVTSKFFRIWAVGEIDNSKALISSVVVRDWDIHPPDQVEQLFQRGAVNKRLMDDFRRRHSRDRNQPVEQARIRVVQWYEM